MAVVHALYYTDPACPWSWAQEPSLRRLAGEWQVQPEGTVGGELWSLE